MRSSRVNGEIRCQFIIPAGNPVSVGGKSGVSSSFREIRCQFIIPGEIRGKSGGKSGVLQPIMPLDSPGEIRCQFIIPGNPVSVHHSGGNPGEIRGEIRCPAAHNAVGLAGESPAGGKSGVSSSFRGEIRCQFIIPGKSGVSSSFRGKSGGKSGVLQPIMPLDSPVKVRPGGKSGVSSSFRGKSGVSSSFRGKSGGNPGGNPVSCSP